MPATHNQIVIDPSGLAVTVDIADSYGTSITSYTTSGGATAHTLPLAISSPTTFHLTSAGTFTISVLLDGVQIAGQTVDATHGVPASYKVNPATTGRLSSLLAAKANLSPSLVTAVDDYTLVLTDAGKTVLMNKGSANILTIPPAVDVAFPLGTQIDVVQIGAGQTTLTAGAGVTVSKNPATLKLTGQFAVAYLHKIATNTWIASGQLAAS